MKKIFYVRFEENEIRGFYAEEFSELYNINFDYIVIDEDLQDYIITTNSKFIDFDKIDKLKLRKDYNYVLTIEEKDVFSSKLEQIL